MKEQLWTKRQVADRLAVSTRTVDRWILEGRRTGGQEGLHPVYRPSSRLVRIPESAVERFLAGSSFSVPAVLAGNG